MVILSAWDERFLGLATLIASWSKDPSTKVGAVAVGYTPNILATGFNGLPPGLCDDERLNDREWKLDHVVHAEMNVLANATFKVRTLYVTQPCCHRCAVHILSHRSVERVVCLQTPEFMSRWADSVEKTRGVLGEAGVKFETIAAPVVEQSCLQRATALIQMLLNGQSDDLFEVEEEARAQLKAWGLKVPEPKEF